MPSNILFPVEVMNRERDYKLILASMVAKETGSVIVAQHDRCDKIIKKTHSGVMLIKIYLKVSLQTELSILVMK